MYEIFEALLQERGITAYKFCKDTGVSSATISRWKSRNSRCGSKLAYIIAQYFGVSVEYVLNGKDETVYYSAEGLSAGAMDMIADDILIEINRIKNGMNKDRFAIWYKMLKDMYELEKKDADSEEE